MPQRKIFIPSGGSRETAFADELQIGNQIFTDSKANPGMQACATVIPGIDRDDPMSIADAAEQHRFDFTLIGGESLLGKRVVNIFNQLGLPIVGPTYEAAWKTELSKATCVAMLQRAGVKVPLTVFYEDFANLDQYLEHLKPPFVTKPDGETLGKGVVIVRSSDELAAAKAHVAKYPGQYVVQDFVVGTELSFFVATDGVGALYLGSARDYKFLGTQMTGGMGGYSPHHLMNDGLRKRIMTEGVMPTIKTLREEGTPYRGFMYFQVMITDSGEIVVIEINARFGDPEAQLILPRIQFDLASVLLSTTKDNEIANTIVGIHPWPSVGVVLAAAGYPGKVHTGDVITGLDQMKHLNIEVFQGGTALNQQGQLVTAGGRVLTLVANRPTLAEARRDVYEAVKLVHFDGKQVRHDIAAEVVA